jgi:hypothetical protein
MFDPYSTNRTIRIHFWKVRRSIPPAAFQLKNVENTPLLSPEERRDKDFSNCKKDPILHSFIFISGTSKNKTLSA